MVNLIITTFILLLTPPHCQTPKKAIPPRWHVHPPRYRFDRRFSSSRAPLHSRPLIPRRPVIMSAAILISSSRTYTIPAVSDPNRYLGSRRLIIVAISIGHCVFRQYRRFQETIPPKARFKRYRFVGYGFGVRLDLIEQVSSG